MLIVDLVEGDYDVDGLLEIPGWVWHCRDSGC